MDESNVGRLRVTNLKTGAITDIDGVYPRDKTLVFSCGDAVFALPGSLAQGSYSGGAGQNFGQVQVPADGPRPARYRFVRQVYDDAPVPTAIQAVDGDTGGKRHFAFTFQRPLTTGSVGRGVWFLTAATSAPVIRSNELWLSSRTITYEHEVGAPTGSGTTSSGAAYDTAILTTLTTTKYGYLRLSAGGVRLMDWFATVERRETDVLLYRGDDGKPDGTFAYSGRVAEVVARTVATDLSAPGARDGVGRLKTDPNWTGASALPGVLAQGYLLAVTPSHIDRYTLDGAYVDRKACPSVPSSSPLGNIGWVHAQVAEGSTGVTPTMMYLAAQNAICLLSSSNVPVTYQVSLDHGATWAAYSVFAGYDGGSFPPQGWPWLASWSGFTPLFST